MEPVEGRRRRAAQLAKGYPYSAELMYFYRDLLDASAPPHDFLQAHPDGLLAQFFTRLFTEPDPIATQPNPLCCDAPVRIHRDGEFPHITIEACDVCRLYRKCVDLSLDRDALPEVDDLASVPLDLWATAQGYRKRNVNLFGL
jgi:hypothetical protein